MNNKIFAESLHKNYCHFCDLQNHRFYQQTCLRAQGPGCCTGLDSGLSQARVGLKILKKKLFTKTIKLLFETINYFVGDKNKLIKNIVNLQFHCFYFFTFPNFLQSIFTSSEAGKTKLSSFEKLEFWELYDLQLHHQHQHHHVLPLMILMLTFS